MSSVLAKGAKCRCCPYGFHICVDFVSFAENVSNGFETRSTPTPTPMRTHRKDITSPLDSIFSDSLENIMSDFEEALAPHQKLDDPKRPTEKNDIRSRFQNGYLSDYTGYRSRTLEAPKSRPSMEIAPSKPPPRPANGHVDFSNGKTTPSTFTTALGKTISEIKARNAESPFPGQESQMGSRVGTPIDLGVVPTTPVPTTPRFNGAPPRLDDNREFSWRRTPSQGDVRVNGAGEFASLRRGREYALSDSESAGQHIRFYSTSPKVQRRLKVAPPIEDSHFTYTQQNGHTILARTQATSMSPRTDDVGNGPVGKPPLPPTSTRSIAVATGPLPPAKPCSECPSLKKQLEEALQRVSIRPNVSKHTWTERTTVDKGVGNSLKTLSVGVSTDIKTTTDRAVNSEFVARLHIDTQTEKTTSDAAENACVDVAVVSCQTQPIAVHHFGVNTEALSTATTEAHTMTNEPSKQMAACQTDEVETPQQETTSKADVSCQTEDVEEARNSSESTGTVVQLETDGCVECRRRRDVFTRNVGVGSCTLGDKFCVTCDESSQEVDENEAPGFQVIHNDSKSKEFELAKASAVKKLLTSEQKQNFVRGTALSKSARIERKRSVDDLDYIEQKNKAPSAPATIPNGEQLDALKSKVVLKKEVVVPSKVPDPVPARIPRPKISKYVTSDEHAQTPDEEEEAADRLTPLRSELRSMGRWQRNMGAQLPYSNTNGNLRYGKSDCSDSDDDASDDDSDGTYDISEDVDDASPFEVSTPLREALESLNSHLLQPGSVSSETAEWALKYVQHEWMKTCARKLSRFDHVEKFVEQLRELGPVILRTVVNITDQNGNSALHYAVSHANFSVVSSLLDAGECELNHANKAGYTAVMLAALSSLEDDIERAVVQRLFEMGDVNAKAMQHGQTALMLAVSHGKRPTTELILECGADVNVQDEEGSTALMCAAEHGHRELVKLLLSQPTIDASLTDCDSSTALSIAVENGHRDIGVLIYAHLNYTRLDDYQQTSDI